MTNPIRNFVLPGGTNELHVALGDTDTHLIVRRIEDDHPMGGVLLDNESRLRLSSILSADGPDAESLLSSHEAEIKALGLGLGLPVDKPNDLLSGAMLDA